MYLFDGQMRPCALGCPPTPSPSQDRLERCPGSSWTWALTWAWTDLGLDLGLDPTAAKANAPHNKKIAILAMECVREALQGSDSRLSMKMQKRTRRMLRMRSHSPNTHAYQSPGPQSKNATTRAIRRPTGLIFCDMPTCT